MAAQAERERRRREEMAAQERRHREEQAAQEAEHDAQMRAATTMGSRFRGNQARKDVAALRAQHIAELEALEAEHARQAEQERRRREEMAAEKRRLVEEQAAQAERERREVKRSSWTMAPIILGGVAAQSRAVGTASATRAAQSPMLGRPSRPVLVEACALVFYKQTPCSPLNNSLPPGNRRLATNSHPASLPNFLQTASSLPCATAGGRCRHAV